MKHGIVDSSKMMRIELWKDDKIEAWISIELLFTMFKDCTIEEARRLAYARCRWLSLLSDDDLKRYCGKEKQ